MSDNVRHPRTFEPPPWERDQFEEQRRLREAEQARLDEPAGTQESEALRREAPEALGIVPAASASPAVSDPARVRAAGAAPESEPGVSDEEMALMLAGLAAQEPDAAEPLWRAGTIAAAIVIGVGVITAAVGLYLIVVQSTVGGTTGMIVGAVTTGFGIALAALGGWVLYLALKKRGA